jgi:hypothetical protein
MSCRAPYSTRLTFRDAWSMLISFKRDSDSSSWIWWDKSQRPLSVREWRHYQIDTCFNILRSRELLENAK